MPAAPLNNAYIRWAFFVSPGGKHAIRALLCIGLHRRGRQTVGLGCHGASLRRGEVWVRDLDGVVSPFQGFGFLGCVMSQGLRPGL